MSSKDQDDLQTFLRPTEAQLNALIDFLEKNPSLVGRKNDNTPMTRKKSEILWKVITKQLNSMPGVKKTFVKWNRYWVDRKCHLKGKLKRARAANMPFELSETERRMVALCGSYLSEAEPPTRDLTWESMQMESNGFEIIPIESKSENVQQECDESPPPSPPSPVSEDDSCDEQVASPRPMEERQLPQSDELSSPSAGSRRESVENKSTAQDIPRPGSSASKQSRPATSPYKAGYRRLKQKLLKVQEHQLQVHERNSRMMQTLLEQSSERECRMMEALNTIGEGMCAIGEGLKSLADIARSLRRNDFS